jgi:hypothetical protein
VIRAVATKKDGSKLLLLGLEDENIRRLKEGQPISVQGEPLGLPGIEVVLLHGPTAQDIVAKFEAAGIQMPPGPIPAPTPTHPVILRRKKPSDAS